jgi:hypothetical protein
MRLSTNISHWVCVFMGLFLIVIGLVSHAPRRTASVALPGEETDASSSLGRRVVLIAIGLVAVAYGVSRVLP